MKETQGKMEVSKRLPIPEYWHPKDKLHQDLGPAGVLSLIQHLELDFFWNLQNFADYFIAWNPGVC